MRKLLIQEGDVAVREFEWGTACRFISMTGFGWEQYLSESTLPTQELSLGRATILPQSQKPLSIHDDEEEAYLFLKTSVRKKTPGVSKTGPISGVKAFISSICPFHLSKTPGVCALWSHSFNYRTEVKRERSLYS